MNNIYYPRTYRHLKNNNFKSVLYMIITVVMPIYFIIKYLSEITEKISLFSIGILKNILPNVSMEIEKTMFSILGEISYLNLDGFRKDPIYLKLQIVLLIMLLIFIITGKQSRRPLSMFLFFEGIGYLCNCLYFLIKPGQFPYGIDDFSQLYVKQQIGIWLTFIVIYGLSTAFLGEKGYKYKLLSTIVLFIYSCIFGVVRYILFLAILSKYSVLYMYIMYFTLGPLFDFLYLVGIYGVLVNKLIKIYNGEKGKGSWKWY